MLYIGCFSFLPARNERTTFNLLVDAQSPDEAVEKFRAAMPKIRQLSTAFRADDQGSIEMNGVIEVAEPPTTPVIVDMRTILEFTPTSEDLEHGLLPGSQDGPVRAHARKTNGEKALDPEPDVVDDFPPFYEVKPI